VFQPLNATTATGKSSQTSRLLSAEGRELVTHLLLTEVRSALAAFAIWLTCQLSERPSTTSLLTQWIMAKWFQDAQL
jgi:hypothetical protein